MRESPANCDLKGHSNIPAGIKLEGSPEYAGLLDVTRETSGRFQAEVSSDFASAALLIQLKAGAVFAWPGCIDPQRAAA